MRERDATGGWICVGVRARACCPRAPIFATAFFLLAGVALGNVADETANPHSAHTQLTTRAHIYHHPSKTGSQPADGAPPAATDAGVVDFDHSAAGPLNNNRHLCSCVVVGYARSSSQDPSGDDPQHFSAAAAALLAHETRGGITTTYPDQSTLPSVPVSRRLLPPQRGRGGQGGLDRRGALGEPAHLLQVLPPRPGEGEIGNGWGWVGEEAGGQHTVG